MAVDHKFAKPRRTPIDDRAHGRVEANDGGQHIVCLTGLCFGEARPAYSGSVKPALVLTCSASGMLGPSTAFVAATNPSCIAGGTSIMRPVTSPAAKICGVEVRRYSSTFTKP